MCLLVAASVIPFHLNPDSFLADDAYFYLQVAENIRLGHGSTFHEITLTNGYHPLWMLCCVAGAFLAGGNHTILLQLMGGLQDLLFFASLFLLWKCGKRLRLSFISIGILVLAMVMTLVGGLRIFEAHLSLTLQLAILFTFLRQLETPSRWNLAGMGMLMGLCMLARMDTVFFCLVVWLCLLPSILKSPFKISAFLSLSLPPCLMLIPYLADNFLTFGHVVPISGMIKSTFRDGYFSYEMLGIHGGPVVISALCLGFCAWLSEKNKENRLVFGILLAAVALHAFYTGSKSLGSQWYYTTAYIAIALSLMRILTSVWVSINTLHLSLGKIFCFLCRTATVFIFGFILSISMLKTTYHFSIARVAMGKESITAELAETPAGKKLAQKLQGAFPKGTAFFTFDNPGMIAYYSDMKIVPLDGLMNDFEYNRQIAANGIASYARQHHIHYLIAPIVKPKQMGYRNAVLHLWADSDTTTMAQVYAPIDQRDAGVLVLRREKLLLRMPNPVAPAREAFPEVGLWQFD